MNTTTSLGDTTLSVIAGRAYPLGATVRPSGVRFAIFSRNATRVWLSLFANADDERPTVELEYDPIHHRTGDIWSIYVQGLPAGTLYAFRIEGGWYGP